RFKPASGVNIQNCDASASGLRAPNRFGLSSTPGGTILVNLKNMPSVFIKTYGCQMNERDSEAVAAQLVAKGWSLAPSENVADVVLLNTCSVRDFAEQKAIGKMQNLASEVRKSRPD